MRFRLQTSTVVIATLLLVGLAFADNKVDDIKTETFQEIPSLNNSETNYLQNETELAWEQKGESS